VPLKKYSKTITKTEKDENTKKKIKINLTSFGQIFKNSGMDSSAFYCMNAEQSGNGSIRLNNKDHASKAFLR